MTVEEALELARTYAGLADRLAAGQYEMRQRMEEIAKTALDASADCRRQNAELSDRMAALESEVSQALAQGARALGCAQTQRAYIEELEAKMERLRSRTASQTEQAIEQATAARAIALGNTGRFQVPPLDVQAAIEADKARVALEEQKARRKAVSSVAVGVAIGLIVPFVIWMVSLLVAHH